MNHVVLDQIVRQQEEIESLRQQLASLKNEIKSIGEAIDDPRTVLTMTMSEVIIEQKKQLAAALAVCKQKDEAMKWLMDWQVKHVDVWDNPAFDNAEEALTIQPDDSALKAWLGKQSSRVKE